MEIPGGNLPSSAEPEIGLNGGGSSGRSPEWVSRQNTLVSVPLLHRHTLNLICGKRSSGFDLSSIHCDIKRNTATFSHKHTGAHIYVGVVLNLEHLSPGVTWGSGYKLYGKPVGKVATHPAATLAFI